MFEIYTDFEYIKQRIKTLFPDFDDFEIKNKVLRLNAQESIEIDANNQYLFIKNIDYWISIISDKGEFSLSNPELKSNTCEHTGKVTIKNLQTLLNNLSGIIQYIEVTPKLFTT